MMTRNCNFCWKRFVIAVFVFITVGNQFLEFGFLRSFTIDVRKAETETIAQTVTVTTQPDDDDDDDDDNNDNIITLRYRHNFTYDRERWMDPPRIVILAGPHKTASSTLQEFFAAIAGSTVLVTDGHQTKRGRGRGRRRNGRRKTPLPAVTDWVFPLGTEEEYSTPSSPGGGFTKKKDRKFYSILACSITGRHIVDYFPETRKKGVSKMQVRKTAKAYFRSLFRRPWDEGKNIVFGSEAFDGFVHDLNYNDTVPSDSGEETHVSKDSGRMIDDLLNILPWGNGNTSLTPTTNTTATNSMTSSEMLVADRPIVPPLRLEDIEVHINYRTPRIEHMLSIWHQRGHFSTFRNYLLHRSANEFYQLNSLALALQFVRKGIKTTIVNMAGVKRRTDETDDNDDHRHDAPGELVVGGLQGTIACEILRMGSTTTTTLCDHRNRIHLPGYEEPVENVNTKVDKNSRNLTPDQMDAINRLVEDYDCGVWQHLQKYQETGHLRILSPTEDLFETCRPNGGAGGNSRSNNNNRDVSFRDTMNAVAEIAGRDNGIPIQTEEEQAAYTSMRKEENQKLKKENRQERLGNQTTSLLNAD